MFERAVPADEAAHGRRLDADGDVETTIRPKLIVGRADDPAEREADDAAALAVARLVAHDPQPARWRRPDPEETRIRRSAHATVAPPIGPSGGPVDHSTESRIRASSGHALDPHTRGRMEHAFGSDLSSVRVHTGDTAAHLNQELGARAFTLGSDVYFGAGEYRPRTPTGDRLLAHELAHTMQDAPSARRRPTVRRFLRFTHEPRVNADTAITTQDEFKAAKFPLRKEEHGDIAPILATYIKSAQAFTFRDFADMVAGARARAAGAAAHRAAVDPFVMKAEESRSDSPLDDRRESASNRYDFRNNPQAILPDIGPDPTKGGKARAKADDGWYYHVTSYANLKGVFADGLNPAAGGGIGGSSHHNADAKMNEDSAKDSQGKVFVSTVGKLTQRYLSFRLRQNDLFARHGDCIVSVIAERCNLSQEAAELLYAQFTFGEEPIVLRFANSWAASSWVKDPIDKAAFALVGKPVPPADIECLTVGGWAPLALFADLPAMVGTAAHFDELRKVLLGFYGEHNEELAGWGGAEGWGTIPDILGPILSAAGIGQ